MGNIGNVYVSRGDFEKALQYYEESLAIQKAALGEKHPKVGITLGNIAVIHEKAAEHDENEEEGKDDEDEQEDIRDNEE